MQTFLPYPNFKLSAACLDYRRCGKQRVETLQILQCLFGERSGWRHHPAVKMWRGYEESLIEYGVIMCDEWISRGYKDTTRERILEFSQPSLLPIQKPWWFGKSEFHTSHQSNLLRKDPNHYGQYFSVPDDLPYYWPV